MVQKKIPALKSTRPKDRTQKKHLTKKVEDLKSPAAITHSTMATQPPQKAPVEKRKKIISYAAVLASPKTDPHIIDDSSKIVDLTSLSAETVNLFCDQDQQDTESNRLTLDSLVLAESAPETSLEPIEIKPVTLVKKDTKTENDILASSVQSSPGSPLQSSISTNPMNSVSTKHTTYKKHRVKKSSINHTTVPQTHTVFVPYPVYVQVQTVYYTPANIQSNRYCSGLLCINGLAHHWMRNATHHSSYFQCQTCSLIIQK